MLGDFEALQDFTFFFDDLKGSDFLQLVGEGRGGPRVLLLAWMFGRLSNTIP